MRRTGAARRVKIIESVGYEIRCNRCDVSFPPDAKVCLHCGGRLGGGLPIGRKAATGPPAIDGEIDPDESAGGGGFLRTGIGSIWILLALSATCYRVCSGG